MKDGHPELNAACKVCGICVKNCPEKAILKLETKVESVDKSQWNDILVFSEVSGGRLHPVSLELIGKARELAAPLGFKVKTVLVGDGVSAFAEELRHYGVSEIAVYDDPALGYFRADAYASCVEDYIKHAKPSVVLVGATSLGRSLAPRLSTRFHTGLTADCTKLELRENTDLVQIRPAFGGNIMAQIITANTRPQFATVRYKVMDQPARQETAEGAVIMRRIPKAVGESKVTHVKTVPVPAGKTISDAEILVVGGRGLQKEADLDMVKELAAGDAVSYGCTFRAPKPMRAATLAVGYADGYPRALSGRGTVSLHGRPARVLGRVCMDQIVVDVTDIPDVKAGDAAIVFGGGAADSVDDVARMTGTINYEVLCDVGRRVQRVYVENGAEVELVDYLKGE